MALTAKDKTFINGSINKAIKPITKRLDASEKNQKHFQKALSSMNTRLQNLEDKSEASDLKNHQHRDEILTAIDAVFKQVKETNEELTAVTHRVYENHEPRIKTVEQHLSIASIS